MKLPRGRALQQTSGLIFYFFVQVALVLGVKFAPKPSCCDVAFVGKIEKLFFG